MFLFFLSFFLISVPLASFFFFFSFYPTIEQWLHSIDVIIDIYYMYSSRPIVITVEHVLLLITTLKPHVKKKGPSHMNPVTHNFNIWLSVHKKLKTTSNKVNTTTAFFFQSKHPVNNIDIPRYNMNIRSSSIMIKRCKF
jgi:hypothetical protein